MIFHDCIRIYKDIQLRFALAADPNTFMSTAKLNADRDRVRDRDRQADRHIQKPEAKLTDRGQPQNRQTDRWSRQTDRQGGKERERE